MKVRDRQGTGAGGRSGSAMAAVLAIALLAAACGGGDGSTGGTSTEDGATPTSSGEPVAGGTLTIAVEQDIESSTNLTVASTTDKQIMGSTVFDPLFTHGEDDRPAPALALSAEPSEDLATWTLTLREGVTFHNGKDFTAQDVVDNFDAFFDPANASPVSGWLAVIDSYEVIDDLTLEVNLVAPDANFDDALMDVGFIQDMDDVDPNAPIGTGPYQWAGRVPGDEIQFERFDDYWRGTPPLDGVIYRIITEPQVAVLQLRNGDIDAMVNYVPPESIEELDAAPDIQLYSTPGNSAYSANFNYEKERRGEYEDGASVRRGLAHLWDPEAVVAPIIGAAGEVATQPPAAWSTGYFEGLERPEYDVELGQQLLADGGIGAGDTIKLLVRERGQLCPIATAFQSSLAQLGYDVELSCLPTNAADPATQEYDWDIIFSRQVGFPSAVRFYQRYWNIANAEEPLTDVYTMRNEELQSLIDDMAVATDEAERDDLGAQIAELLVNEEVAIIPIYVDNVFYAVRDNVHGFEPSGTGYYPMLMNARTTVYME